MACGTGKTFTSLKIAEKETENKGVILFLVPSIALLGQTLKEWSIEATETIHPICICSDSSVGKEKEGVIDLPYPASTNIQSIIKQYNDIKKHEKGMKVVFSTYQSIFQNFYPNITISPNKEAADFSYLFIFFY